MVASAEFTTFIPLTAEQDWRSERAFAGKSLALHQLIMQLMPELLSFFLWTLKPPIFVGLRCFLALFGSGDFFSVAAHQKALKITHQRNH